jgi:hypothetical protein
MPVFGAFVVVTRAVKGTFGPIIRTTGELAMSHASVANGEGHTFQVAILQICELITVLVLVHGHGSIE